MLQVRSRHEIVKLHLFNDQQVMKEYIKERVSYVAEKHDIPLGQFDFDSIVSAFGGIFTDYDKLFNMNCAGETIADNFNIAISNARHELSKLLAEYSGKGAGQLIEFLERLDKTQNSMKIEDACSVLKNMFHVMQQKNWLVYGM